MRLIVTIQMVKNGYLISYPKSNKPDLPNQHSYSVSLTDNAII